MCVNMLKVLVKLSDRDCRSGKNGSPGVGWGWDKGGACDYQRGSTLPSYLAANDAYARHEIVRSSTLSPPSSRQALAFPVTHLPTALYSLSVYLSVHISKFIFVYQYVSSSSLNICLSLYKQWGIVLSTDSCLS